MNQETLNIVMFVFSFFGLIGGVLDFALNYEKTQEAVRISRQANNISGDANRLAVQALAMCKSVKFGEH